MQANRTSITFDDLATMAGRDIHVRAVGWVDFETFPAGKWTLFTDASGSYFRAYSPREGRLCLYRAEVAEIEA